MHQDTHNTCGCGCKNTEPKREPSCSCASCAGDGHEHDGSSRLLVCRLLVGALLFGIGLLLPEGPAWFVLAVAYIVLGYNILWQAVKNVSRGFLLDENFLMSIASLCAIIIGKMSEAVAVMLFYQFGEWLSAVAVSRSRKSISELMDIRPDFANLVTDTGTKRVKPEKVQIGDIIVVSAGEKIPLDGEVIEGESYLDTAALTGESVPRMATVGDMVLGGCINTTTLLKIRVTKSYADSSVSKIMTLLENARHKKSNAERFITAFAKRYTPIVVSLAVLIALIPPLFLEFDFSTWVYRAMVFLVVSCPCALVVSVPLGFFAGIGCASKNGILIKGSNTIEELTKLKTVALDKTGTITKGEFTATEISATGDQEDFLRLLARAEYHSTHPIAKAIIQSAASPVDASAVSDYTEIAGQGISVCVDGKAILAGNRRLMENNGITPPAVSRPGSVVYMAVDGVYAGYAVVSDIIRPSSPEAIGRLQSAGIKTVMLSGDTAAIAEEVGKAVGVDAVFSELLPQDKVAQLEGLQKSGKTAFVGDGINDAPVLAYADVGIAMGGVGSDSAIEAADMVIMADEPMKIPLAIRIANRTMGIVRQNIIFSIGIKILVLILGALGISTMWMAIFADVGVTLIAVLNAVRAMYIRK